MTADVSVIIPCFNCAPTIGRAVASVARQTALPQQIIMVDDGSQDHTYDVMVGLQRTYGADWLQLRRMKNNGGPAIARNAGWDAATCRLIAFLDSDDAWHPHKVSQQIQIMHKHEKLGLCGHLWRRAGNSHKVEEVGEATVRHGELRIISRGELLLRNCFITSSVMLRKVLPFRFDKSFRYAQDYALWLEMVLSGVSGGVMGSELAFYFKNMYGDSGQTKNLKNHNIAVHRIYRKLELEGRIATPLRYALDFLEGVKYQRRRAVVFLRSQRRTF